VSQNNQRKAPCWFTNVIFDSPSFAILDASLALMFIHCRYKYIPPKLITTLSQKMFSFYFVKKYNIVEKVSYKCGGP
jgi:hypothetical protein